MQLREKESGELAGYDAFQSLLLREASQIIEGYHEAIEEEYHEVFVNILFNRPGPKAVDWPVPKGTQAFMRLFRAFTEIGASFQVQKDISAYIRRFPHKSLEVSKARFLRYHVGNYLNEVYILRERLLAFPRIVTRTYSGDRLVVSSKELLDALREQVLATFNHIVTIRGVHVHKHRYDDDELLRLDLLELLAENDSPFVSDLLLPQAIHEFRKKWQETISTNNETIEHFLDQYFSLLRPLIFDKQGRWRVPPSVVTS